MTASIEVVERGQVLAFTFADLLRHHGPGSAGGVALGVKALERALPLLASGGRCERREVTVATAFGGPGARDAVELVTRAVTDGRFRVDPALARPQRGRGLERFVFRVGHRGREVTVVLRDGFVIDAFSSWPARRTARPSRSAGWTGSSASWPTACSRGRRRRSSTPRDPAEAAAPRTRGRRHYRGDMRRTPTRSAVLEELERVAEQLAVAKTSPTKRLELLRRQAHLGDLRDTVVRPPRRGA